MQYLHLAKIKRHWWFGQSAAHREIRVSLQACPALPLPSISKAAAMPATWKKVPQGNGPIPLYQWQRLEPEELPAASEFTPISLPYSAFSPDEYEAFLADPNWTRSETEHLMRLCIDLNLCFPVVVDRYTIGAGVEDPPPRRRSLEEVKDRFLAVYSVYDKLRGDRSNPLLSCAYNKKLDVDRRKELQAAYASMQDTVQEEAFLSCELETLLRENYAEIVAHRDEMFLLHAGEAFLETCISGSAAAEPAPALDARRRSSAATRAPLVSPNKSHPAAGVYLRSNRLHPIRVGYTKAVDRVIADYGLAPKPTFATSELCTLYEQLRQLALRWLEAEDGSAGRKNRKRQQ